MSDFYIISKNGYGEIVEKKSKFIANVFHVSNEQEAAAHIEAIRKKYWDARHNSHAFTVGVDMPLSRCSDDGEPSGTAGKPMLEVLLGKEIHNVAVVVTRYFGGTLLGTGGLVRAYTQAVQEGLAYCSIVEKNVGYLYNLDMDYTDLGKVQYQLAEMGVFTKDTAYEDRVKMEILIPRNNVDRVNKKLIESTSGRIGITAGTEVVFGMVEGEMLIFQ